MRTEEDIRQALRSRADEAPVSVSLADLPRRHQARRRRRVAVASVCGVVSLVAGSVTAVRAANHSTDPTPAVSRPVAVSSLRMPAGPELSTFTVDPPPGYRVTARAAERGYSWLGLATSSGVGADGVAAIYQFSPGTYQANYGTRPDASLAKARSVSVGGRTLYLLRLAAFPDTPPMARIKKGSGVAPVLKADPRSTVVWEYVSGSWAAVQWRDASAASDQAALQVARAVHLAAEPLLTPFSIDYLPARFDRRWAALQAGPWGSGFGSTPVGYPDGPVGFAVDFGTAVDDRQHALLAEVPPDGINVRTSTLPVRPTLTVNNQAYPGKRVFVNGRTAYFFAISDELYIPAPGGTVIIGSVLGFSGGDRISEAELTRVALSMRFAASLTDTSTWFDATQALPH